MKTPNKPEASSQSTKLKWGLPDKPQMIFLASILVLCAMILLNELLDFPAFLRGAKANPIDWYKFATEMSAIMLVTLSGSVLLRKTESKRKRTEEEAVQNTKSIESLSKVSMGFLELPAEEDIYRFIGEQLRELIENPIYILVNSFDQKTRTIQARALLADDQYMQLVSKTIGTDLLGMSFVVSEEAWNGLISGKLVRVPGGIHELSFGKMPKAACDALEKLAGTGNILVMGFSKKGELYGSATIIMRKGCELKNLDIIETFLRQAGVALQRKRAEDEIKTLKRQMEFILGVTKTGLDIIDSEFNIRYIDPEWQKVYGDSTGIKCHDYFMGRSEVCPGCGIIKALKTKKVAVTEEILIKEDDRPIQVTTIPYQDERGEWLVAEVNVDITGRKQVEEALQESNEIFNKFMENSPNYVFFKNDKIQAIRLSNNYEKMLGKPMHELLGKTMDDLFPSDLAKSIIADDLRVLNGGEQVTVEEELNGRFYTTIKFPILIKGKPRYLAGYTIDITERKQVEEALSLSEQRLKKAQAIAHIGNWDWNIKENNLSWSDELYRIYGVDRRSFVLSYESIEKLIHPDDRDWNNRQVKKLLESAESGEYFFRVVRPDGEIRYLNQIFEITRDQKGTVIRAFGTIQDITERKRAEEEAFQHTKNLESLSKTSMGLMELPAQEDIYRYIGEQLRYLIGDAIYILVNSFDQKTRTIQARTLLADSPHMQLVSKTIGTDLSGMSFVVSEEAWNGLTSGRLVRVPGGIYELSFGKMPKAACDALEKLAGTGDILVMGFTKKEELYGSATIIMREGCELRNSDIVETFMRQAGVALQRKRAEEALRESEGRFRQLAENIDQVFWLTDWENDKLLYVNPSYEKMFGRSCQSAYEDRLSWYQAIHPDDRDRVRELLVRNAQMGQSTEVEYRIMRDDGEVRWILDRNYPIRNQEGKVYRIVSIADDITDRKQAEQALKENEERLELVLEGAELGTWDQNMKTGDVIRNRRWAEILGYTLEEIESNSDAWKALIHPDDLPVVNQIARDHETGRTQFFKCEHRMRTKLGEWKWILNCGKIIQWDSDGTPVRATGTHADITERKKAEEALRESQKRFQALTETTSDFVWEMDVNGVYTYCSPQIHELWGYQPEDMIGRTPFDLMMPEDREYAIGMFRNLSESPSSFKGMETSSRDNTGRIVVLETSGVPFFDIDGRLRGYRGISRDITERKRAEEALRESEEKFRTLAESAQCGITIVQGEKPIYNNPAVASFTGYSKEELESMSFWDMVHPDFKDLVRKRGLGRHDEESAPAHYEIPILTKNSEKRWIDISVGTCNLNGKPSVISTAFDITERKRAEKALRESEEKFRQLFTRMPSAVAIYAAIDDGEDFIFKDFNTAAENIEQIKKADLIGKRVTHIFPSVKDFGIFAIFQRVWRTGQPEFFPSAIYRDEHDPGTWRESWVYKLASGEVVSIYHDITQRKQAEEEIYKLNQYLQSIIDNANVWLDVLDEKANVVIWNKAAEEISGYRREEVMGHGRIWEWLYPNKEFRNQITAKAAAIIEKGEEVEDFETTIRCKDGEIRTISWNSRNLVDEKGTPIGSIALGRDVTERKQAEKALKQSEERYRTLFDRSLECVYISDFEGNFLDANPEALELLGYTKEDILHLNFSALLTDAQLPLAMEIMSEVKKTGSQEKLIEYRLKVKDGGFVYVETQASVIYSEDKSFGILGIARDITERKKAEEKIKIFSDAINSAFDCFTLTDENGNITYANESAIRAFGYTPEEFLKLNITELDANPGIANKIMQDLAVEGKWSGEVMNIRKNKEIFPCILSAFIIKDVKGNPKGTMGILRDITARKKAEEKLRESEEKLRLMFKSVTDGITVTDLSGIITECNEQTLKTHGYRSKDEILGKSAFALIAPKEHEKAMANMKKVLGERAAINTEYTLLRTDGSQFYGELSVSGLTDASGNLKGAIAITRDITERKRVEQELKDSYARLSTIFHSSPISIAITRLQDSQFVDVNEAWQRITGYSKEEAIGHTPIELDTWVDPAQRDQLVKQLQKRGMVRDFEFKTRHRSGTISDLLLTADLITLGGESYMLSLAHDITEKKKMEAQLIQSERLAAVGTLAYGIAHEFNNILAGILGNAELGTISHEPDEVKECLGIIMENCDRAKSITYNLLAFSSHREVRKEKAQIANALESVIGLVERELEKRNINVVRKFKAVPDIYCDIGELSQVALNMVTNARDAMMPKGGTLTVEISKNKGDIEMIFSDTGCGIPNSIKSRIFEPFVTTKGALGQSEIPGTGLGLFLSYGIINRYGGKIEVESKVGAGSKFTIKIPISANQTPLFLAVEERKSAAVPENLRILLVDDEKPILNSIKSFLITKGHSVVTTTSGKKGLWLFGNKAFDLVLSDITMPDMDGFKLISRIKSIDKQVKLIALTGHLEEEKLKSAQKAGADQILVKPFKNEDLYKAIGQVFAI